MNKLINVNIKNENGKLLVGSRDIAVGLEKEHKDVLRKIEDVLTVGEFSEREFTTSQGNKYKEYLLDKNAFILLVMNYTGYNDFKRAYIKRFDEMEKQLSFYIPQSFPEALRCLAAEVEQKELMQKQRDEGARPHRPIREPQKAQAKNSKSRAEICVRNKGSFASFSSLKKREAMNTASQKSREVEKLKRELDKSKEFASIKAAEIRLKSKFDWKPLRNYCTSHELEMPKIFDANYGSVRTYPAEAWQAIYGVDFKESF